VTHWRTTRATVGGNQSRGPHISANSTRAENVISLADHFPSRGDRLNSGRLTVAPSFIREFAAWCFVAFCAVAPAFIVTVSVIGYALYALLVAQPVEY
jgi:hypothetical protein